MEREVPLKSLKGLHLTAMGEAHRKKRNDGLATLTNRRFQMKNEE
jgi:hypothetical protein